MENNITTKHENERIIRNILMESPLADTVLTELKVKHIDAFYQPYAKAAPSAARNAVAELRKVLDLAVVEDWLETNPARTFRRMRKRPAPPKYAPDALELSELKETVVAYRTRADAMGPRPSMLLEDVIDTILGTSARIGEALGLRWFDVDLHSDVPTVSIRGTVIEGHGRPKEYQPHPKTESGERTVPIPPFLVKTLRRRRLESPPTQMYVFTTRTGAPNGPQDVHRALRRIRDWSATADSVPTISDDMVPKALRKSVATAIAQQESLADAARTLGHTQSNITEKHYAKRQLQAPDMRHVTQRLAQWADDEAE